MTPAKAIRLNCRFCNGGARAFPKCESRTCALNNKKLSALERIKRYCVECAAGHKPEECNGVLLGTQRKILADLLGVPAERVVCPLLPYRMGKNQNLRWKRSEEQKNLLVERTRQGRLEKKEALVASGMPS